MAKTISFFVFLFCYYISNSQIISGIVKDIRTNEPILYASVFFNGTFVGTSTDHSGNFTLDISGNRSMPITISAIGYYSAEVSNYNLDKPLIINLKPKVYGIKEVIIADKSLGKKREENLQIFRNAFLGRTENSQQCKIINESDISFNYYSDQDTLKAFSPKPIIIENRALGYNVTYYLDVFEYYKKNKRIYFSGSILFNPITLKERTQKYYERKRKNAYLGSRMHFFRSLYSQDSTSSDFAIFDTINHKLSLKTIVVNDTIGMKLLTSTGALKIYYHKKLSRINFLTTEAYFNQNGYFDPRSIEWDGDLAIKRVADWLPYEYKPE